MSSELFSGASERDLVALARAVFPHEGLADDPYRRSVETLLARAGTVPRLFHLLSDGLAELSSELGVGDGELVTIEPTALRSALQARQSSDFFVTVRSAIAWSLYDDREVWAYIGYPGPSFEHGGYLYRGFNDLAWLPEPRVEESSEPFAEIGPLPGRRSEHVLEPSQVLPVQGSPAGTFDAFTGPDDVRAAAVGPLTEGVKS